MDKDRIEKERIEYEAQSKALDMLLSMLEAISPDSMQPIIQLPKLCRSIDQKKSIILKLASGTTSLEKNVELASEANMLLARIDEALEAFIEQHTEGGNVE